MNCLIRLFLKSSVVGIFVIVVTGFPLCSLAEDYAPYPQPDNGYVTDLANLLTLDQEEKIETWLWQVESRINIEIIVVTIPSIKNYPGTKNRKIEDFATGLFDRYGIGNMPDNNGILLLVAKNDRKARIELGAGYGFQKNREAEKIMQKVIIPEFKHGNFASGIKKGTQAIISEFAGVEVGFPWRLVFLIVGSVGSLLIGYSLVKSGKKGWGYVFVGLAIVLLLAAIYVAYQIVTNLPDDDSSGWSSGGSGGFGGGFSGGGGATGSW